MPRTDPVFIIGCPRSGTSLLYSMLASAGDFAVYRAETRIFDVLGPRFGNLLTPKDRARALDVWLKSDQCTVAGLDMGPVQRQILEECRNTGDFLRIFMESMARQQGNARWAEDTPGHILFMREIKRTIPNALFVHVIRDGRDVAVSLDRQQWVRPFPWDRARSVLVAGIYWQWMVSRGLKSAREIGPDYLEVHYEDLLTSPQQTLDTIGAFIGQKLDYEQIRQVAVGTVRRPNTSFASDQNFIGRWRKHLTPEKLAQLEYMIGPLLEQQGYQRAASTHAGLRPFAAMRRAYECFFEFRYWAKVHTPLGRWMVDLETMRPGAIYGPASLITPDSGCGAATR